MPVRSYLPARIRLVAILLIAVVGILTVTLAPIAFAHEGREAGDYNLVVGFIREPAYEGQLNAVSLVVTKPPTEAPAEDDHRADDTATEMEDEAPDLADETEAELERVNGLASSLQVEISHVPTDVSRVLPLTELADDLGHYVAEFVPTAPGEYRVRFFGSIEGNAVDETFDSGPDTFDTVIASDAVQFPVVLESNREIQNATRGALDAVQELETDLEATSSNASTGMIIGILGIILGLIAIGTSFFAITIARRRN